MERDFRRSHFNPVACLAGTVTPMGTVMATPPSIGSKRQIHTMIARTHMKAGRSGATVSVKSRNWKRCGARRWRWQRWASLAVAYGDYMCYCERFWARHLRELVCSHTHVSAGLQRENIRAANAAKAARSVAQERNIRAWMRQMPRPTMASRTDSSIELVLVRRGVNTSEVLPSFRPPQIPTQGAPLTFQSSMKADITHTPCCSCHRPA